MLRFVLSVVVLLILSSCGGKYAFEMSRNYAPPYNPGGDYFDDDESFAQSYEIYEKRREDALREQESMKKRNRGRDLQQKSGRRQISDEEKGRIIDELQRYGVMYNAGERRKGGMVNSEGIDLSRVRGARFIDVDLNKSGVISGKEKRVDESILVKTKEGELLDAEEQSSMLSGGLPGDSADEEHEEFEVNIDCDCGDDCDCPTGAHKSHGGHKKLSHPVEEEEQSPALDVVSSELPKDDIAEDQEGVKVDCDCGDDCDCPAGAHKSHGGHKKLSHPVEEEEQSPALDVVSSELPKDDIAEDQEGVKVDCDCGDDCDCPTGAHKSHGGHKKLSHPVEEEEQSPALDVVSSELPKDDIAEDQEGVKVDCDCGDDCDCPTGAHKSHGGHKKLSHPVEEEEQSPALDVVSSELPKDDIAEDQEGIEVKGGCNAGDDCPSDELNPEHGNKEVAVYGEEGASSKDEDNVAEYGSVGDVGSDSDDVVEDNDIYPWWEEYDVVEGFGAFDDSSDEDYESESSPVFGGEERAEEDFDAYQDPVEEGGSEGVTDSSEDLAAGYDVDSVTGGEEGDYLSDDGDEGGGDITNSPSAGKGVADDLSVDDSTFLDEGGYKGIDKDGDGYRIPLSLPDSRSRYYDLGDFVSLR
ncbi:metallothionein family protein [Anaplasma phagocytophilum str. CRT53-1]|uniref:Metallothionein family protein n=1 Tax=Anaplasma phagocytophilum str. CRT53-1 TaxID=1359157 RepID=A0A0F3Q368_ANAPH|nr:metallothionein family protein [Anaplasma phagocytophilum str. CRT53-1]